MQPVAVRILHPTPANPKPLERELHEAQGRNAQRLLAAFERAGAADVEVLSDARDTRSFSEVLRALARSPAIAVGPSGLIVLGAGSMPLATIRDLGRFVDVAASGERRALANNSYSADIIAVGQPTALAELPDLPADNALPRWLREGAAFEVGDLRSRWRLAIDLDSPLDVLLTDATLDPAVDTSVVRERLAQIRAISRNRRGQLVVAGRTSAATLRWLEHSTESRTRALVEERGLRASAPAAMSASDAVPVAGRPRSVLGLLLDDRGPDALGEILRALGDAALVDSRVLLAHRLGPDERDWPATEDRFASDLLLADRIDDPWLRSLTTSARDASIPIVLGGHTLVGPGVRLALRARVSDTSDA